MKGAINQQTDLGSLVLHTFVLKQRQQGPFRCAVERRRATSFAEPLKTRPRGSQGPRAIGVQRSRPAKATTRRPRDVTVTLFQLMNMSEKHGKTGGFFICQYWRVTKRFWPVFFVLLVSNFQDCCSYIVWFFDTGKMHLVFSPINVQCGAKEV